MHCLYKSISGTSNSSGATASILSSSGNTASILSSTGTGSTKLRSYASSRDILEMYGTIGGNNTAATAPPLTPRMLGFSSSDLRLPPSTLLMSLSGKKSNSTLNVVDWNPNPGGGSGHQQTPSAPTTTAAGHTASISRSGSRGMFHQHKNSNSGNVTGSTLRAIQRDTIFWF